jgi:hypothetical protein
LILKTRILGTVWVHQDSCVYLSALPILHSVLCRVASEFVSIFWFNPRLFCTYMKLTIILCNRAFVIKFTNIYRESSVILYVFKSINYARVCSFSIVQKWSMFTCFLTWQPFNS